jgi:ATP-dependent exoDNAse (exonuclease V) alpha subunit
VHTYVEGDTLRFSTRTASLSIRAGDYATVRNVNGDTHRLTVQHEDGRILTYDPNRLYGVNIYREETRLFSVGDRVQFKQPFRDRDVANAKLGTILAVSGTGIRIKIDGREKPVAFTFEEYRHLDYGYAVTSYSSQGLTARRVILDVDCDQPGGVSNRVAYTALSRGVEAAVIYTNDAEALPRVLDRDNSHRSAIEPPQRHRQAHGPTQNP